jgi:hypothetical protein
MSETLKERLERIERAESELRAYFAKAIRTGEDMYVTDFLLLGILKRTLAHADGFRGHIEKRNFICAGTLLRSQLDTALRANAISLVNNPDQFASDVLGGAAINKMKDRDGKQMRDAYLAERLAETRPWVLTTYKELAEIGHFSRRHIFASVAKADDATRTVHFQISAEDPQRPEEDYFEVVECFYATMKATCEVVAEWHAGLKAWRVARNRSPNELSSEA